MKCHRFRNLRIQCQFVPNRPGYQHWLHTALRMKCSVTLMCTYIADLAAEDGFDSDDERFVIMNHWIGAVGAGFNLVLSCRKCFDEY